MHGTKERLETRERLAQAETEPGGSHLLDQRLLDEVYVRRAKRLALRQAADDGRGTFPALVVRLGTERYAIELSELSEVHPYGGCTTVPGAPPVLIGVINVRGEIKSVADLRRILDLPPGDDHGRGYVVMVRRQGGDIGLKVDAIDGVRQIDPAQLVSAGNSTASLTGSRLVKAITADTVILIDTNAALASVGLAVA